MSFNMWGLVGGIGAGAGLGLARNLMAPKADPLPVYTPKPIQDRLADLDPSARNDLLARRSMATKFMTGEIPSEVKDQVEMLAAEKSWRGGFGTSPRATNLTARDLGLMSLSLMQTGADMADKLTRFEVDMAITDANEEYKAFVGKYNGAVQANAQKAKEYDNLWNSIISIGTMSGMSGSLMNKEDTTSGSETGTLGAATKSACNSLWSTLTSGTRSLLSFDTGKPISPQIAPDFANV